MKSIKALGQMGTEGRVAVPLLRLMLDHQECWVRCFAAVALVRIEPAEAPECVDRLVRELDNSDNDHKALTSLCEMGPAAHTAVPALHALLRDPSIGDFKRGRIESALRAISLAPA